MCLGNSGALDQRADIVGRGRHEIAPAFLLPVAHAETIAGRASVIDGDTIEIHGERIRILDVDAPESRQTCIGSMGFVVEWRCGQEAALKLSESIGARTVACETTGLDRYKRHLARCSVDGEHIAVWLPESGWVFPYRNCKCELIRAAVDRAKAASILQKQSEWA